MVENLYGMLKQEHRDVKELFRLVIDQRVHSYFPQIKKNLCIHMNSEEDYLYPPLENVDRVALYEASEEHKIAKRLIKEINIESDDMWLAKIRVLREIIEHHIKEEETRIFGIAEKTLRKEQEEEIISKFKEAKSDL